MIDQPTIDRILDAAQIYDVVSDFVTLRKRGVNYVGLCPFHDDKTPSFYVSPAKGLCKCFACGKGGNAVHFIMEHEQMSYPEALKYLAKKYGIEIKERELSNEEKLAQSERESLFIATSLPATISRISCATMWTGAASAWLTSATADSVTTSSRNSNWATAPRATMPWHRRP